MKRWLLLAFLFAVVSLAVTARGLRYNWDTHLYLEGARALQTDGVLSTSDTLNHFPPLQAVIILASGHNLTTMRLFYALVMAGNVLLLIYGLIEFVERPALLLMFALAIGLMPYLVYAHSFLLSDTPFILMTNAALLLLYRQRYGYAAVVVALSCLQRYAGVVLIGVGVIWILQHTHWRKALLFGVVSALPVGLWLLRGSILLDRPGREIGWHPITAANMVGLNTLIDWFLPITLICLLFWFINRSMSRLPQLPKLSLLFTGSYLLFLFVSISLFDPATALYGRILLPMLIPLWWVFVWFIEHQLAITRQQVRPLAYGVLMMVLALSISSGVGNVIALALTYH